MRRLESIDDLLDATHHDVYVRGSLRRAFVAGWTDDDGTAVAWVGTDNEEQRAYVCVLGDAQAGATLLASLIDPITEEQAALGFAESRVSVLRPIGDALVALGWALEPWEEWEFRWTSTVQPSGERDIRWTDDLDLVDELLVQHSPGASARPGAAHVRRWAGAYDGAELVATLADTTGLPAIGHLSSIATSTERRGGGWGAAITSWAMEQLLSEGCEAVTLGVHGHNATAIRLYDRLGFDGRHQFRSGVLVPRIP